MNEKPINAGKKWKTIKEKREKNSILMTLFFPFVDLIKWKTHVSRKQLNETIKFAIWDS